MPTPVSASTKQPRITRFHVFTKPITGHFRTEAGSDLWLPDGEAARLQSTQQDSPRYLHGTFRTHDGLHTISWLGRPVVPSSATDPSHLPAYELALKGPDDQVNVREGGRWVIVGKLWAHKDAKNRTFYSGSITTPEIGTMSLQVRLAFKARRGGEPTSPTADASTPN